MWISLIVHNQYLEMQHISVYYFCNPANLTKLISVQIVFVSVFRIFLIELHHAQIVTVLLLPSNFFIFIFLLIVVPRTSTSMLQKKIVARVILVLEPFDLPGNASSFSPWLWCCLSFVIPGLYHVEVCSFYAHIVKRFYSCGCWILSEAFA